MRHLVPRYQAGLATPHEDAGEVDRRVRSLFPEWVPSPVEEILWVKRVHGHLGARVILFDDVPCLIVMDGVRSSGSEVRWIYRGLTGYDTRPFFFHRMRGSWMRANGTREETAKRHGLNFV